MVHTPVLKAACVGLEEVANWPGMTVEIKDYIAKCAVCAAYQKKQPKKQLVSHKIPNSPWETIGCGIFHLEDRKFNQNCQNSTEEI